MLTSARLRPTRSAQVPKKEAAERPREIGDREKRVRRQKACGRIAFGKEQPADVWIWLINDGY
jgi:hypothetical protein